MWLSFRQNLDTVIAGFEAAWEFFGGVFKVVIPDNMATIVTEADATAPTLNQAFVEYAQARGFVIDPARVRSPQDKPRVERTVAFVQGSFWAGEDFGCLAEAQVAAELWCRTRAGLRDHGTHPAPAARGVRRRGGPGAVAGTDRASTTCRSTPRREGPPGSSHPGRQGPLLGPRRPDRPHRRRPRRQAAGEDLLARPARQVPRPHDGRGAGHRPRRSAVGEHRLRDA